MAGCGSEPQTHVSWWGYISDDEHSTLLQQRYLNKHENLTYKVILDLWWGNVVRWREIESRVEVVDAENVHEAFLAQGEAAVRSVSAIAVTSAKVCMRAWLPYSLV